jgi:hypothetical protein
LKGEIGIFKIWVTGSPTAGSPEFLRRRLLIKHRAKRRLAMNYSRFLTRDHRNYRAASTIEVMSPTLPPSCADALK